MKILPLLIGLGSLGLTFFLARQPAEAAEQRGGYIPWPSPPPPPPPPPPADPWPWEPLPYYPSPWGEGPWGSGQVPIDPGYYPAPMPGGGDIDPGYYPMPMPGGQPLGYFDQRWLDE